MRKHKASRMLVRWCTGVSEFVLEFTEFEMNQSSVLAFVVSCHVVRGLGRHVGVGSLTNCFSTPLAVRHL